MSNWVYDRGEIKILNQTEACVCTHADACGNATDFHEDWSVLGHIRYRTCKFCVRWYLLDETRAVHPDTILQTDADGVVAVSERNAAAFEFIIRGGGIAVLDELWNLPGPLRPTVDAVLYAVDGNYVSALYYGPMDSESVPAIRAIAVDSQHRRNGYSTDLITQWFETRPEEALHVWATTNQGEQFFDDLDINTTLLKP